MSTDPLRVLIAEDEAPARRTLRELLARVEGVVCVGEGWGRGALDEIRELRPDIVLLDVRMPGMDGFEVVGTLQDDLGEEVPEIVVVTAHEEHAVEAFEVRAVDYLLKPFTDERFFEALERAMETVRLRRTGRIHSERPVHREREPSARARRLLLEDSGTTFVVSTDEIRWIEASGPYVIVHAEEDHMIRRSLASFEDELSGAGFARVHRSAVINLAFVRSIRPLSHGDAVAVLDDGTNVRVSRSRREAFEALLGDLG